MDESYDVIVVGAGNGGLAAAATTAKGGLKTLLLEKHNLPGGCATSFVRGRFEFEPSLHELCMVGDEKKPDLVYNVFKELGAKPEWQYEHNLFRSIVKGEDGYDVTMKAGITPFMDSLESYCPGSKKAIKKLFEYQKNDWEATQYITKMKGKPNPLVMAMKYGNFMRMASHSMEDVLKALKLSPKAIDIMCTYWGYLGVPTDELSAFHYWNMMSTYIVDGAAMGKYRSHELSLSLCKVIYDNGGDIFYNSEVTSFLYNDKGEAIGVEINHDKKIYAKEIVSNLIPNRVANMSPSKDVPERTKKLINARSFGISTATIYLGLDCSREELGFDDYTIFISGSRGARAQYDKRDIYIVNCLNKVIPDATPEGTCSLFFTMPVFGEDIPKDMTPEKYEKWKNELAMRYIKDAEETLKISIIPHIEEIEIATPVTMARYLGTPTGTIYGYKLSSWDNLMARIAEERKDITVPNLSYCGGHYMRGDGFNVAYYTGNLIGHRIVKKLKGVESKQLQPGERK